MPMSDFYLLPFCHIQSEKEFLTTILNEESVHSRSIQNINTALTEAFNPISNTLESSPSNWDPSSCKYSSLDQLASSKLLSGDLTITHIHTRSLKHNFEPLKTYLSTFPKPPSIVALSETWLREDEDKFYSLPGYKL